MVHTHIPRQPGIDRADIEFVPMHSGECVSGADEAQWPTRSQNTRLHKLRT